MAASCAEAGRYEQGSINMQLSQQLCCCQYFDWLWIVLRAVPEQAAFMWKHCTSVAQQQGRLCISWKAWLALQMPGLVGCHKSTCHT